ncbi:hypothetical protein FOZ62_020180 [Perkinsus olseni]|uniref:Uncharacterized protein n=1 Tax=Perkinsus olseni TaxID=32597 RepID=A0A7J6SNC6_PEROL|nr:hypothetical protein FOZ62_020180 [Perkinsus olseni]
MLIEGLLTSSLLLGSCLGSAPNKPDSGLLSSHGIPHGVYLSDERLLSSELSFLAPVRLKVTRFMEKTYASISFGNELSGGYDTSLIDGLNPIKPSTQRLPYLQHVTTHGECYWFRWNVMQLVMPAVYGRLNRVWNPELQSMVVCSTTGSDALHGGIPDLVLYLDAHQPYRHAPLFDELNLPVHLIHSDQLSVSTGESSVSLNPTSYQAQPRPSKGVAASTTIMDGAYVGWAPGSVEVHLFVQPPRNGGLPHARLDAYGETEGLAQIEGKIKPTTTPGCFRLRTTYPNPESSLRICSCDQPGWLDVRGQGTQYHLLRLPEDMISFADGVASSSLFL